MEFLEVSNLSNPVAECNPNFRNTFFVCLFLSIFIAQIVTVALRVVAS